MQIQPGLLLHLPDRGGVIIFTGLYQTCRKLINIAVDRISVLANQNNLIMIFPVKAVNNHSI